MISYAPVAIADEEAWTSRRLCESRSDLFSHSNLRLISDPICDEISKTSDWRRRSTDTSPVGFKKARVQVRLDVCICIFICVTTDTHGMSSVRESQRRCGAALGRIKAALRALEWNQCLSNGNTTRPVSRAQALESRRRKSVRFLITRKKKKVKIDLSFVGTD